MLSQARGFPEMIELYKRLKAKHGLKVVVVSNEGRELTADRIRRFNLKEFVDIFVVSSYVHFRKPDEDIFRIALDVAQAEPAEVVYVDDRQMFAEVACRLGMHEIWHRDLGPGRAAGVRRRWDLTLLTEKESAWGTNDESDGFRDLRRRRRPGLAQADPGPLQPLARQVARRAVQGHRPRHQGDGPGRLRPAPARGGGPVQPAGEGRGRSPGRRSPGTSNTSGPTSPTPRPSRSWPTTLDAFDAQAGKPATRVFYLATPPTVMQLIAQQLHDARVPRRRPAVAPGVREALRPRPRQRPRAQRLPRRPVRRVADLPHRPLPGQGAGAEHPRLPLRQLGLRAALEPPLHRLGADHRRRGGGGRHPRRLLRPLGRPARHGAEPPDAGALPDRHGAAGHLRGRRAAQQEGGRAAGHPPPEAGGRAPARRARPVRRRG